MLRRLYDWTMGLAGRRQAEPALFSVSFVESSVFPIPPDVLMIPMVLARRSRAFVIATIATVGSVLGALLGYWIGAVLMDSVGQWVLTAYGKQDAFDQLSARFSEFGIWAVLIAAVTPFPFKVITLFSGAAGLSLPIFIVTSIIGRSLRFFIVAGLLWKFGEPIRDFIERRLGLVFTLFCVALIGGFALLRFL
ncbi:DedA family protein [Paracoccus aestuarii]|uniref:DedA family protein n=1 Tax=Paracoccus aestuarii TaxID=453842 RepID=A0A418ZZV6_9RHOB|nr:YqaA family protein [Paracoccus aestuarii]RJL06107.1 DedA family protein [Paracoccus aestuarii]WCQ98056.1 DedA family protein [Paracoccus aestuarii]